MPTVPRRGPEVGSIVYTTIFRFGSEPHRFMSVSLLSKRVFLPVILNDDDGKSLLLKQLLLNCITRLDKDIRKNGLGSFIP